MIYVNVDSPNLGFPYFLGEDQWKKHPVWQHAALEGQTKVYMYTFEVWSVLRQKQTK